jgi:hypothetical protein
MKDDSPRPPGPTPRFGFTRCCSSFCRAPRKLPRFCTIPFATDPVACATLSGVECHPYSPCAAWLLSTMLDQAWIRVGDDAPGDAGTATDAARPPPRGRPVKKQERRLTTRTDLSAYHVPCLGNRLWEVIPDHFQEAETPIGVVQKDG